MPELSSWKFCPRCGASIEISEGGSRAECPECGFRTYATAKPTASAICVDDRGRVLLGRRARQPDEGKWDLPGGFLDEDEHPVETLRRELREEASVEIEPLEFFDIVIDRYGDDDDAQTTLNLYWLARIVGGDPRPADDVAELRWFAPDELPAEGELAFRNNARVLSAWRARDEHA